MSGASERREDDEAALRDRLQRLPRACPQLWTYLNNMVDTPELRRNLVIQPEQIDAFGTEIRHVYRLCSEPESSLSERERKQQGIFLGCIARVIQYLEVAAENGQAEAATLKLFYQTIYTPENLKALCRMCDGKNRTDMVRCHAAMQLVNSFPVLFVWKIKMPGDGTEFALCAAKAVANILDPAFSNHHYAIECECATEKMFTAFVMSLRHCKEPSAIINELARFDWKEVYECGPALQELVEHKRIISGIFKSMHLLHDVAAKAIKINNNNTAARKVLKSLGSCDRLCRGILRMVSSGGLLLSPGSVDLSVLDLCHGFLVNFFHCLIPHPKDQEFQVLMRVAESKLMEVLALLYSNPGMEEHISKVQNMSMMLLFGIEGHFEQESPEECWERFSNVILEDTNDAQKSHKELKKVEKQLESEMAHASTEEQMCANCKKLESQLNQKFDRCSSCRRVHYCR